MSRLEIGSALHSGKDDGKFGLSMCEQNPWFLRSVIADFSTLTPYKTDYFVEFEAEMPIAEQLFQYTGIPCFSIQQVSKKDGNLRFTNSRSIYGVHVNIVAPVLGLNVDLIIESAERLRDMGAKVEYAMFIVEEEGQAAKKIWEEGIWANSLFKQSELVILGQLK